MLYTYTKDHNYDSFVRAYPNYQKIAGLFSIGFLFLGIFLIAQVAYPIIGWYVFLYPSYSRQFVSPLSSNFISQNAKLVSPVQAQEMAPTLSLYANNDSYAPTSWFPQAKQFKEVIKSDLKVYSVSVPKLHIDTATVEIGGDDLKKSLVAWPTSAVPGSYGANIIFGHSELPQFASPKDYSGIFTHIMDLAQDDTIFVDYDGVRYKYQVFDKKVVDPEDISVLEQRFDDRYLTLITCVPPGTLWKRGIVKARMSQL